MNVSESLIDRVRERCYITDTNKLTISRVENMISTSLIKVKRMIGVSADYDFEDTDNGEELELFLNYCWYVWNDSTNEFKNNYLDDINSIRHKHEVEQYASEENI